jgi:beta-N-acetylhexosaminidase
MVGVSSSGLSSRETGLLRDTRAGSVILLGNTRSGVSGVRRVSARVRREASTPEGVRVLLAADQEGGQVQRLQGRGFDVIPSAKVQAELTDAELTRRAEAWGRQLRDAGIDADLAPVADVVPRDWAQVNRPIGRLTRAYGSDPDVVADKAGAFIAGMDDAGVATAVKHFPGLGRVRGNTDFESRVVDRTTTRGDPTLRGFAAGVAAGADMVMVASAYYAEIDPKRRAAFSPTVITKMIRADLGFAGVVISDDLAAQAVGDLGPAQRALRFLTAGGDLVIVGDPSLAPKMTQAVRGRAEEDPEFARRLQASVVRVLALKERRGLAQC